MLVGQRRKPPFWLDLPSCLQLVSKAQSGYETWCPFVSLELTEILSVITGRGEKGCVWGVCVCVCVCVCVEYMQRQIHVPNLEGEGGEQKSWWEDSVCGQDTSAWEEERCFVCSFHGVVWLLTLYFPRELLVTRDITF